MRLKIKLYLGGIIAKLNILQINSASFWGGGEAHLYQLSKGLIEKGHQVTIIARKNSEVVERLSELAARIKELPLKGAIDIISVLEIADVIREQQIDIIHVHLGRDYWLGVLARKFVKRGKVVATRHVLFSLGKTYLHRQLYASVDRFIAVSRAVKGVLVDKNQINEERVEVIYNGVDIEEFKNEERTSLREELGITKNEFLIGVVGRLCARKNQEFVIEAANRLKDSELNLKHIIVGEDSSLKKEYETRLKQLINKYSLQDRVFLIGFRKNIAEILNILDLLVIPSLEEAFGIIALEGMASGTPVVANKVGGLVEVIKDGETGILTPVNDINSLTEIIIDLLTNQEKRDRIIKRAREEVREKFSIEVMINRTEELYKQL